MVPYIQTGGYEQYIIIIDYDWSKSQTSLHILVSVIERASKQPWGFPRESTTGTMVISNMYTGLYCYREESITVEL